MDPEVPAKRTDATRIDTVFSEFGPRLLDSLPEIVERHFGQGPFLIVSDERIRAAVGRRLDLFLERHPDSLLHILPAAPAPYASDALVAEIAAAIRSAGATPIAVGAGTVNDVVKRAAFEAGRRYACVPTAPSVDGYTAYGAAITVGGFKTTLECPAPLCVVADEEIIAEAPYELIASGYGDLVAKLTGGADWILADAMGLEAVDRECWDMVQPSARAILGIPSKVRAREKPAIAALFKGLAMTGLAMQRYRDSRPASGAEHLLSHAWEMTHPAGGGQAASHGYKVAIGTLVSAALFSSLFSEKGAAGQALAERGFAPARRLLERRLEQAASALEGHPALSKTERVLGQKTPGPELLAARARLAGEKWEGLRAGILAQLPSFDLLKERLAAAGCPVEPADIGLSRSDCARALTLASLIRPRYTVLDFASELDVLEVGAEEALSTRHFSSFAPER